MSAETVVLAYVGGWLVGALVVARELGPYDSRADQAGAGVIALLAGVIWPLYLVGYILARGAEHLPRRDDR